MTASTAPGDPRGLPNGASLLPGCSEAERIAIARHALRALAAIETRFQASLYYAAGKVWAAIRWLPAGPDVTVDQALARPGSRSDGGHMHIQRLLAVVLEARRRRAELQTQIDALNAIDFFFNEVKQ
jgi:hypothetical protein